MTTEITPYRKGDCVGYQHKNFSNVPNDVFNQNGLYLFNDRYHSWPLTYYENLSKNITVIVNDKDNDIERTILCACIRLFSNLFGNRITHFHVIGDLQVNTFPNNILLEGVQFTSLPISNPTFTLVTEKDLENNKIFNGLVLTSPTVRGDLSSQNEFLKHKKSIEEIRSLIMYNILDKFNEDPMELTIDGICSFQSRGAFVVRTFNTIQKCVDKLPNYNMYREKLETKDITIRGVSSFLFYYLESTKESLNPNEIAKIVFNLIKELNSYLGTEKLYSGRDEFGSSLSYSFNNINLTLKSLGVI